MMRSLIENRWAFMPVALLAVSFAICATGVTIAVSGADPAEPDYYRKGAQYDSFKAQVAQNGFLGWVVTSELVASTADPRLARLQVTVADKHGIVIDPAEVQVEVVPIRDATQRATVQLARVGDGRYAADVPVRIGGQWELRLTVDAKGKRYTDCFRRPVMFGPRKVQGA